jgi:signal transduction histidine kinase
MSARKLIPAWAFGLLVAAAGLAPAADTECQLQITSIAIGGRTLTPQQWTEAQERPDVPLELGADQSLRVTFQQLEGFVTPIRLRHRLDGRDAEWQNATGVCQFKLEVLDRDNRRLDEQSAISSGDSPGWTPELATDRFFTRQMQQMIPVGADRLSINVVTSMGDVEGLGMYAFRNVTITIPGNEGDEPTLFSPTQEEGRNLDDPMGEPAFWTPGSRRAGYNQVARLEDGTHALLLLDSDLQGYASWRLGGRRHPPLTVGKPITITWQECHSLGRGGEVVLAYSSLASGRYRLRLGARALDGQVLPGELSLYVRVLPPWWGRPITWAAAAALLGLAGLLAWRQVTRLRLQRRAEAAERASALEHERTRIARDLHDDLGTSLAQIIMLGDLVRSAPAGTTQQQGSLDQITRRAADSMRKLREIVWAVDPGYDGIEHLVAHLIESSEEHLTLAGVQFRTDIPDELPDVSLSSAARHQLALSVREALHNAVRHGRPDCITLRVEVADGQLAISISDDGEGCDPIAALAAGRGVANLHQRLAELGGSCRFTSSPGAGSTMLLLIPCPETSP